MQPCYTWLDVPYYWAGLKAYDAVANVRALALSRFVTAAESLRRFPTLAAQRRDGATLKGTVRSRTLVVAPLLPQSLHDDAACAPPQASPRCAASAPLWQAPCACQSVWPHEF